MLRIILVLATCLVSYGQVVSQPTDLVGMRVGYDAAADPTASGGFIYAHRLTDNAYPTYSYTQINFVPQKFSPYVHMTTTETGVAQQCALVGPFKVYCIGTVGGAFAGGNVGFSASGGGVALAGVGKSIFLGPYARASKATISTAQYEFGFVAMIAFK